MTAAELRRRLDRVAESAPTASVPDDTWARARRALIRDRVLFGVVTAAVAVSVVGAITWLPSGVQTPVAESSGPGVPDHLFYVPEWVNETDPDLKVGRVAVAFIEPSGHAPVVVDADEGGYHVLDLPEYSGDNHMMSVGLHESTIALSPDGRSLAYSWARFGAESASKPIPSGIRVLDLESGAVTTYELPGAEGTAVENIVWSPSGTWLGWAGGRLASWTALSMGGGTGAVGRIRLSDGDMDELTAKNLSDASVGIDDAGVMAIGTSARVRFWNGGSFRRAAVASPLESRILTDNRGTWVVPGPGLVTVIDEEGRRGHDIAFDVPGESPQAHPLGWVGDELVVATYSNDGKGWIEMVPADGGDPRTVTVVDVGTVDSLTVAVDLMSGGPATVSRPEPDWPFHWSGMRISIAIGLGALVVIAAWIGVRRLRR